MSETFATTDELGAYLQIADINTVSARLYLELATGLIQGATGQTLSRVLADTVVLRGYRRIIPLPQRPVTAVTAIALTDWGFIDYPAAIGGWRLTNGSLEWRGDMVGNLPETGYYGRSTWPRLVTVTYDHGYVTIPDDVRRVCITLAAERYINPSGIDSETVDDYSYHRTGRYPMTPGAESLEALVRRYKTAPMSVPAL